MPNRRPHTKSRLGCAQCKKRHIKCDQVFPICGNCTRTSKKCTYAALVTVASETPSSSDPGSPLRPPQAAFDALDMILMHQFSTETAATLAFDVPAQHEWQNVIPVRAMSQPLLMHGLLALAGMHRAYIQKDDPQSTQRCYLRALDHQQLGMQLYRSMLADPEALKQTDAQEALMAFSAILGALSFAQARFDLRQPSLEEILALFALWKGMRSLWDTGMCTISSDSELANIFGPSVNGLFDRDCYAAIIDELEKLLPECENDASREAIETLRYSLQNPPNLSGYYILGGWPTSISDEFMALLRAKNPLALKILRQYSAVLTSFGHVWYLTGWSQMIERAI